MSNISDFIIENGVLTRYTGPGGDVIIPEGVTEIGCRAFANYGYLSHGIWQHLTGITIPESVTRIREEAFRGCTQLTEVVLPSTVTRLGNGLFRGCTGLKSLILPNGLRSIPDQLCCGCEKLTDLYLPTGLKSIGRKAFSSCAALSEIEFPESLTAISYKAFSNCPGLRNRSIPEGCTNVQSKAFCLYSPPAKKPRVRNVPQAPVWREDHTFLVYDYELVKYEGTGGHVDIPSYILVIDPIAFKDCTTLESVTIHGRVWKIGCSAFEGCTALREVTILAGKRSLSTRDIGFNAFRGCTALQNISIQEGIVNIDSCAFCNCTALTRMVLPYSVQHLSGHAFEGCTGLRELVIPSSIARYTQTAQHWGRMDEYRPNDMPSHSATVYAPVDSVLFTRAKRYKIRCRPLFVWKLKHLWRRLTGK